MTKKTFTGKGGETWEWEETPEATEAIKRLHDDIRRLKAEDGIRDAQESRGLGDVYKRQMLFQA